MNVYLCQKYTIMTHTKVRVRFAPSPTGPLHIGGVRTALFNYLFARKHEGDFILRIEDTDQTRFVKNAENYIVESLQWCGITIDEGIGSKNQGEFGPYRQSERKSIYKKFADILIASGHAYYAFDTAHDLQTLRKQGEQNKTPFVYNAESRGNLCNSLVLSEKEVAQKIADGVPYVIRFKMPETHEEVHFFDKIRDEVTFNTKELDDKVLYKSDGMPTYHLANVVDDHTMRITHVIRGEEWLSSTPLHVLLYRAFGWEQSMPKFAHLPLILKPQGQGKLSKRDGDKLGFPVFPLHWVDDNGDEASGYKESGYFPEAFVNMLALLGWNPGTEQEIFTMDELISSFSLERVGKSGSKFDPEKTKWFNQQWMQRIPFEQIILMCIPLLQEKGVDVPALKIAAVCEKIRDRLVFPQDIWQHAHYFFEAPQSFDRKLVQKNWKNDIPNIMETIATMLSNISDFSTKNVEEQVKKHIQSHELHMGQIMICLRLSLVGNATGIHLFDIMEFIGKDETVARILTAIEIFSEL